MKVFDVITEDNYLLYAANKYSNPQCTSVEDFYDDSNANIFWVMFELYKNSKAIDLITVKDKLKDK